MNKNNAKAEEQRGKIHFMIITATLTEFDV